MNEKNIARGYELTTLINELKEKYKDAQASYQEVLKVSLESNSEELDVELARAETEVNVLADVLAHLGVSLEDPIESEVKAAIEPEIKFAIIDILTVEAIGQIGEDIEHGGLEYLASMISGDGYTPLIFRGDQELLEEVRRVFGTAENFSPLDHCNVDEALFEDGVLECFPQIKKLLEERISE